MKITTISLLVVCSIHYSCALKDVLAIGTRLYEIVDELTNVTRNSDTPELRIAEMNDRNTEVGRLLGHLLEEINGIEKNGNIHAISDIICDGITVCLNRNDMYSWILKLMAEVMKVDSSLFQLLFNKSTTAREWQVFARQAIDIDDRLDILLCKLHYEDLPSIITNVLSHANHCKTVSSIEIFLRQFFQALIVTEIKGLTILTYANIIEYSWMNGWHGGLHLNVQINSKKRFIKYVEYFAAYMDLVPKDRTACDPDNGTWVRDETYFEMKSIEHTVIFHAQNKRRGLFRSKVCHNPMNRKFVRYDSVQGTCSGKLSNCKYSRWLKVCRLKNNRTQYEWIKSTHSNYGMNISQCLNGSVKNYKGISNWFKIFCICKCRDGIDHNWISLDPVMTDVTENMVISGLRLVCQKGTLHMQVRQAKLRADGLLDENSHNWIPLPKNPKLVPITATNRKFYLDDVILPDNYLAIGIEFNDNDGFSIGVTAQKFNVSTGQLLSDSLKKVSDHADYKQLVFPRRNSIYANLTHKPDSDKNWIQLEMSDLTHNAGQSMLPLFDATTVESTLPLEGIGMVHRGVKNYAGFISPRLFPLQYRKRLLNFIKKDALKSEY